MKIFTALKEELKRELKGIGRGLKSIVKPETIEVEAETLFMVDFKAKLHERDGYKKVGEVMPSYDGKGTTYRQLMCLEDK